MISKRKIASALCAVILTLIAAVTLPAVYTAKDTSYGEISEKSFFIEYTHNRIDRQDNGQCAAYASAYVLRHFGDDTAAEELDSGIRRIFGFTPPDSVVRALRSRGYEAKAYHGDIGSLKARVSSGDPVIVFISIPNDTHYAVVTGYDEDSIYIADSMRENANADESLYNRKLRTSEFEELWKTNTLIDNNVYITVKEKR